MAVHPAAMLALAGALLATSVARAQPWVQRPLSVPESLAPVQDLASSDRASIERTIETQLRAFRGDDDAAAFALATPRLRKQFGSAERFMENVRRDYRDLLAAADVDFLDVVWFRSFPTQRTRVRTESGRQIVALYMMRKIAGGAWRIAGCVLVPDRLSRLERKARATSAIE